MVTKRARPKTSKSAKRKPNAPKKPKPDPASKPSEETPNSSDSGLLRAAMAGDDRGILEAALKILCREAETAHISRLHGLIREIRNVSHDLAKLPKGGRNAVEDLQAKRARRRAKATRP